MIKHPTSLWWLIASVAFILTVSTEIFASPSKRPNILLIMAEDMSHRVGAFGDPVAITPNLDELASRSLLYPNPLKFHEIPGLDSQEIEPYERPHF